MAGVLQEREHMERGRGNGLEEGGYSGYVG